MCTYILKDMNIESYALFCIPAGLNAKKKKKKKQNMMGVNLEYPAKIQIWSKRNFYVVYGNAI